MEWNDNLILILCLWPIFEALLLGAAMFAVLWLCGRRGGRFPAACVVSIILILGIWVAGNCLYVYVLTRYLVG